MSDLHLVSFYRHAAAPRGLSSVSHAMSRCRERLPTIYLTVDLSEVSCKRCRDLAELDFMRDVAPARDIPALEQLEASIERGE